MTFRSVACSTTLSGVWKGHGNRSHMSESENMKCSIHKLITTLHYTVQVMSFRLILIAICQVQCVTSDDMMSLAWH